MVVWVYENTDGGFGLFTVETVVSGGIRAIGEASGSITAIGEGFWRPRSHRGRLPEASCFLTSTGKICRNFLLHHCHRKASRGLESTRESIQRLAASSQPQRRLPPFSVTGKASRGLTTKEKVP